MVFMRKNSMPNGLITVTAFYDDLFDRYDDRIAIKSAEQETTYTEFEDRTAKIANFLYSIGLGSDDKVGILMENRPEYLTALIGAMRANVIAVPLNSDSCPERIKSILRNLQLDVLVISSNLIDLGQEIQHSDIDINYFLGVGPEEDLPLGFHNFNSTLSKATATTPPVNTQPDDIAAIYHTGGTTGEPKATVHDHRGICLNLYAHFHEMEIRRGERLLLMTPLGHSAGFFSMAGLAQGGTVYLQRTFDPEKVVQRLESDVISWMYLTPKMVSELLKHARDREISAETLNTLVYGSAPLSSSKLKEGIEQFGDVFVQFYGLTEIPNLVTVLPKVRHDPTNEEWLQSAGRPARLAEVTIFTEENTWSKNVGEVGIRAPYAMIGYLDDRPHHSNEQTWIRTGDIGRLDEKGRLHILDRIQNVIISDGQPVFSTEVENVIEQPPDVFKAAVIGVPKHSTEMVNPRPERTEQSIKAIVVPNNGENLSETAIQDRCREKLDSRQVPNSVDIVGELPETPYGKIDRRLLREPYW